MHPLYVRETFVWKCISPYNRLLCWRDPSVMVHTLDSCRRGMLLLPSVLVTVVDQTMTSFCLSLLLIGLLILPLTVHSVCRHPTGKHHKSNLTLKSEGCTPKTVQVKICEGECSSTCYPQYRHGRIETKTICHGCTADTKKMIKKEVKLQCGPDNSKIIKYEEASKCLCVMLGNCEIGSRKGQVFNEIETEKYSGKRVPGL